MEFELRLVSGVVALYLELQLCKLFLSQKLAKFRVVLSARVWVKRFILIQSSEKMRCVFIRRVELELFSPNLRHTAEEFHREEQRRFHTLNLIAMPGDIFSPFKNVTLLKFKLTCGSFWTSDTNIISDNVDKASECGLACLEIPSCLSYNLAVFPNINHKLLCELLPSHKYNNSEKFIASSLFLHFSIYGGKASVRFDTKCFMTGAKLGFSL